MKKIAFVLYVSFTFLSCNNSEEFNSKSACGVNHPIEDLAWLKNKIEQIERDDEVDIEYSYIKQTSLEKQDVFIYGNCNPLANSVSIVYNCSGENIGYICDEKFSLELLNKATVIWKTTDNKCNF